MEKTEWVLLDTETTGLVAPIYVVELAAQRMRGWATVGVPFRKLIDQNLDIPPEASRVHGYTREILERDGEQPHEVYREFADYVGDRPIVAFNLEYDLDKVLLPEWMRLKIAPIGCAGFCALRLAQRFLDPVPAGNCKLQTLRQYYHLPERGAHTALGDVATVADLLGSVLRPIAEQRGLDTWAKVVAYAAQEWYPTRVSFGKYRGQSFWQAQGNKDFRQWLEWLAKSDNGRTRRTARWYLRQLDGGAGPKLESVTMPGWTAAQAAGGAPQVSSATSVMIYVHPTVEKLREMVAAARTRLAELESAYTAEKAKVDAEQAKLFKRLRGLWEKRDRLRLVVSYRKVYWEFLLREGEESAGRVEEEFQQARARTEEDYRQTEAAMAGKRGLSDAEEGELKRLWRKLVKLSHPDRFATEPEKHEAYEKLTMAINQAKECGNLETLRQIADDPGGFMLRQGWAALDFGEERELTQLRRLWESLEAEIVAILESTNQLKESAEYELYRLLGRSPGYFEQTVARQTEAIGRELSELQKQADELERQISEVTTGASRGIG